MALSRVRDEAEWPQEIRDAVAGDWDGELEVREPGTPGEYQNGSDTYSAGAPGQVVLSRRPARAQQIHSTDLSGDGNSWETRRRYRFQCDILESDLPVTKGLVLYFFGGHDPELAEMVFQVVWAANSSHAAVRTIDTITEGARVND